MTTPKAADFPLGNQSQPDDFSFPRVRSLVINSMFDDHKGSIVGGILIATTTNDQTLTEDSGSAVTNNWTASGAPLAGGIALTGPGFAEATGATVSGNTGSQCLAVIGC